MVAISNVLLLGALSAFANARQWHGAIGRFRGNACTVLGEMDMKDGFPSRFPAVEGCHSWDDGKEFNSVDLWSNRDDDSPVGGCKLQVFREQHCQDSVVREIEGVSEQQLEVKEQNSGDPSWCVDYFNGPGKSVAVVCQ